MLSLTAAALTYGELRPHFDQYLINIGCIWPSYPNSLGHFKYFFGCIVCISNSPLNRILFILAHVICIFVTHVPVSMSSLAK